MVQRAINAKVKKKRKRLYFDGKKLLPISAGLFSTDFDLSTMKPPKLFLAALHRFLAIVLRLSALGKSRSPTMSLHSAQSRNSHMALCFLMREHVPCIQMIAWFKKRFSNVTNLCLPKFSTRKKSELFRITGRASFNALLLQNHGIGLARE